MKNEVIKHFVKQSQGYVHAAQEDCPTQNQGNKSRVQQMWRGSGIAVGGGSTGEKCVLPR